MKPIVCLLLAVFLLCGCTQFTNQTYTPTGDALIRDDMPPPTQPPQEAAQDITLVFYPDKTMNPYASNDYTNRALFSLIYQGLFNFDRNYQVQPVLCKSYSATRDMRTYVFYLENATFSNGRAVTAADVVASFQQAKASAYYSGRFTHISSFSVTEDGGVQVKTSTPMENLPLLLDIPIVPAEQVEADIPLGTGPYMLDVNGMNPLLRRTNWWSDAQLTITAPAITLYQAKTSNQSLSQIADYFKFDGLDLVCVNPCADPYADYMCDYELWSMENGNFLYLACSADSSVLTKSGLRKALTYAIDRDTLATTYYRNFGLPATLPASPRFPHYSQALAKLYAYNPEKFALAVEESGMAGREVVLLVNSQDSLRTQAAKAIAEMLEAGGLKVTLSKKSGSSYDSAVRNREYDLYLGQTKLSPNMDLSAFFYTYGALSFGGINDVTAYTLSKAALANYGNYYTLHETVMEEGLLCPVLFQSFGVFATRGKASFLTPARDNVFYYSTGKTLESARIK